MKGILFVEFVDFLEQNIGEEQTQELLDEADLESAGAYSRVGQYDYQEMIQLLTLAASTTGEEAEVLLNNYTDHLFEVFNKDYADFFKDVDSGVEMLKTIDDHIHVEVRKLYPDAELPKFTYQEDDLHLHMDYVSPRPLASIAQALLTSCLKHFGNNEKLIEANISADQKSARFTVAKK